MPQIFKIYGYVVYFWSNEGNPLEPVHVHIALHNPAENATKIWITKTGRTLLCNNNSRISSHDLRKLMKMIEANSGEIIKKWNIYFNEIRYYC